MTRVTLDSNIYLSALVFGRKPMRLLAAVLRRCSAAAAVDTLKHADAKQNVGSRPHRKSFEVIRFCVSAPETSLLPRKP